MECPVNNCPGKEDAKALKRLWNVDEHKLMKKEQTRKGRKKEKTERKALAEEILGGKSITKQLYYPQGNVQYVMECQFQVYHRS